MSEISRRKAAGLVIALALILLALILPVSYSSYWQRTTSSTSENQASVDSTVLQPSDEAPDYILAGGQIGRWFTLDQYPELDRVNLGSLSGEIASTTTTTTTLTTITGLGTVWTGGYNGTDWLVTGWGAGKFLNPYFSVFNETADGKIPLSDYSVIGSAQVEWAGGDIFTSTWDGSSAWLLGGLGSGPLYQGSPSTNHMSVAILDSNGTFTDLSEQMPDQQDAILYASAWDGQDWLVGGGYYQFDLGALYMVSPSGTITDVTDQLRAGIPSFDSVQSIGWNGEYFLIGGIGFLAEYNPQTGAVSDLTGQLDKALGGNYSLDDGEVNSINSIAWTGKQWMIAGGVPIAFVGSENQTAWVASSDGTTFSDLSSNVIPSAVRSSSMSSILSMDCNGFGCVLGGFVDDNPVLLWYGGSTSLDLSGVIPSGTTYIQWVGLGFSSAANSTSATGTTTSTTTGAEINSTTSFTETSTTMTTVSTLVVRPWPKILPMFVGT